MKLTSISTTRNRADTASASRLEAFHEVVKEATGHVTTPAWTSRAGNRHGARTYMVDFTESRKASVRAAAAALTPEDWKVLTRVEPPEVPGMTGSPPFALNVPHEVSAVVREVAPEQYKEGLDPVKQLTGQSLFYSLYQPHGPGSGYINEAFDAGVEIIKSKNRYPNEEELIALARKFPQAELAFANGDVALASDRAEARMREAIASESFERNRDPRERERDEFLKSRGYNNTW